MTYKTHTAFAMLTSIPISVYSYGLFTTDNAFFLFFAFVGSLAPDLDEEGSYLSRRIPIFPMIFKLFGVKHRGITHRLISVFILAIAFSLLSLNASITQEFYPAMNGFIFGYFMHLIGDMLTKGGINNFFYPISNKKGVLLPRNLRFYTGSFEEAVVFMLIVGCIVFELVVLIGRVNGSF